MKILIIQNIPVRDYNSTPPKGTPPGFKEVMRTIQGLIRPNRVLNLGGVYLWGGALLQSLIQSMPNHQPHLVKVLMGNLQT